MKSGFNLTINKLIPVSQKKAFEAWLNIEAIKQFMLPMAGTVITETHVDARVGGGFSFTMNIGESKIPIHGVYRKVNRYEELSFTWNSPHVAKNSLVILQFKKISEGETELTLHHQDLENIDQTSAHTGGWENILENLSRFFL
ncbi:MAG: SRPBCC domain-containing protein [Candidatus Zixiibacteriota bacterium]